MTPEQVVATIRATASERGFPDVDVLLATAWQESGWRDDAAGDRDRQGVAHSIGPFQEHDQGRGAGRSVAQRMDVRAATNRAIDEFLAVRRRHPDVSRGQWAALAQRPADARGYAANIEAMLSGRDRAFGQAVTRAGSAPGVTQEGQRGAGAVASVGGVITEAEAPRWLREAWAAGSQVGRAGGAAAAPASTGSTGSVARGDQGEVWPVAGQPWGKVNNPFGGRQARTAGATVALPSYNTGADLTAPYGASVVAPVSGTVVEVFDAPNETDRNLNHGFGGSTLMLGDNGYYYRLSHARPGSIATRPGQRVRQGQQLHQVGVSGNSSGPHADVQKFTGSPQAPRFVDIASGRGASVRTAGAPLTDAAAATGIPAGEAPDWLKQAWAAGSRVGRDVGHTVAGALGVQAATAATQAAAGIADDLAPDWLKDAWKSGSTVGRAHALE